MKNKQDIAAEIIQKLQQLQQRSWTTHKPVPSADPKLIKGAPKNEDVFAQQLANMLQDKSILGPVPPRQPTDQELFGHLVVSEDKAKEMDKNWQNAISQWTKRVTQPLPGSKSGWDVSEEDLAYWDSIKTSNDGREE